MKRLVIALTTIVLSLTSSAQVTYFYTGAGNTAAPFLGDVMMQVGVGLNFANPAIDLYQYNPTNYEYPSVENVNLNVKNNLCYTLRFDGSQSLGEHFGVGPRVGFTYGKQGWSADIDGSDLFNRNYWDEVIDRTNKRYTLNYSDAVLKLDIGFGFDWRVIEDVFHVGLGVGVYMQGHFSKDMDYQTFNRTTGTQIGEAKKVTTGDDWFEADMGLNVGFSAFYFLGDSFFVGGHVFYNALPFFSSGWQDRNETYGKPRFCESVYLIEGNPADITALLTIGWRIDGVR